MLPLIRCPKCKCVLGDGLREGQETTCSACGMAFKVHYTLKDQLCDPIGLLVRDPKYVRGLPWRGQKYVSRKFQVGLFIAVVSIVFVVMILIARGYL